MDEKITYGIKNVRYASVQFAGTGRLFSAYSKTFPARRKFRSRRQATA